MTPPNVLTFKTGLANHVSFIKSSYEKPRLIWPGFSLLSCVWALRFCPLPLGAWLRRGSWQPAQKLVPAVAGFLLTIIYVVEVCHVEIAISL